MYFDRNWTDFPRSSLTQDTKSYLYILYILLFIVYILLYSCRLGRINTTKKTPERRRRPSCRRAGRSNFSAYPHTRLVLVRLDRRPRAFTVYASKPTRTILTRVTNYKVHFDGLLLIWNKWDTRCLFFNLLIPSFIAYRDEPCTTTSPLSVQYTFITSNVRVNKIFIFFFYVGFVFPHWYQLT